MKRALKPLFKMKAEQLRTTETLYVLYLAELAELAVLENSDTLPTYSIYDSKRENKI